MNTADLVADICDAFKDSGYPRVPFDYSLPDVIVLHIRVPPTVPIDIKNKYKEIADQVKASPSIERIEIGQEHRGKGIFRSLIAAILDIDFVECVCIINVHDENLRQYFLASDAWSELIFPQFPQTVIAPRNFYTKNSAVAV